MSGVIDSTQLDARTNVDSTHVWRQANNRQSLYLLGMMVKRAKYIYAELAKFEPGHP